MHKILAAVPLLIALNLPAGVLAEDHQVLMLNMDSEGRVMQFEPAFLKVATGDTVTFVPTDNGHNSESLRNKIPEGADGWRGRINEEITVTFDVEGHYAYKCLPHLALGMVGFIEVGDPGAPDAALAEGLPAKAKSRLNELIAQAADAEENPAQ